MPNRFGPRPVVAAFGALAIVLSGCVAPAGGNEPATSRPRATTTTTSTLPPAIITDYMDPHAPGLGSGGFDAKHYEIDMAFTLNPPKSIDLEEQQEEFDPAEAEPRIEATTTIDLVATQPLDRVAFDFTGSTVTAVDVDGVAAEYEREATELIVTLPERVATGTELSVAVEYNGAPGLVDSRVARVQVGWTGTPGGTWHVLSEPDGAHRWFPASDHPSDKATYQFDIRVPLEYAAGASGTFEREYSGIEFSSYRWVVEQEIPPSAATAVIGDVTIVPDEQTSVATGIEIRHLLPPDMAADPPAALGSIADMIGFFEERYGAFPYDAFGVAVVDGPMTGMGTNSWAIMTRDQLEADDAELAIVGALVHHWFGDSLTPATWSDIWLATSFVRYSEWLWIERDLGDRYADAVASKARSNVAQSGWPPPDEPRVGDAYLGSVFIHGAIALHAVRLRIGDGAFFDMLATFYDTYAGSNASTENFRDVVRREAGSKIVNLYETWFTADELPGFPDR